MRSALLWPPALGLSAFSALDVHGLHGWGWGVDSGTGFCITQLVLRTDDPHRLWE